MKKTFTLIMIVYFLIVVCTTTARVAAATDETGSLATGLTIGIVLAIATAVPPFLVERLLSYVWVVGPLRKRRRHLSRRRTTIELELQAGTNAEQAYRKAIEEHERHAKHVRDVYNRALNNERSRLGRKTAA